MSIHSCSQFASSTQHPPPDHARWHCLLLFWLPWPGSNQGILFFYCPCVHYSEAQPVYSSALAALAAAAAATPASALASVCAPSARSGEDSFQQVPLVFFLILFVCLFVLLLHSTR